jgi:hypothetical protein
MRGSAFDPGNAPPPIPQVGERTFRFEFSDATHHTACAVEFAREGVVVRHFYNASLVSTRYIPWEQIDRLPSLPPVARGTR